jgi:hypothetical protein
MLARHKSGGPTGAEGYAHTRRTVWQTIDSDYGSIWRGVQEVGNPCH